MKKHKTALVAALVVIGVTVLGLAAAVYAKYIASLQASGGATIAKWNFETENSNTTVTCSITSTVVSGTVASGKIAPGTSGTCTLSLSNTTSEVAVDYTIKANETDSTNIPTNLELSDDGSEYSSTLSGFSKTGTLAIGDTGTTVTIYWRWPYETGTVTDGIATGDSADTTNGEAAYSGSNQMSIAFDISGVQHNPASAIAP